MESLQKNPNLLATHTCSYLHPKVLWIKIVISPLFTTCTCKLENSQNSALGVLPCGVMVAMCSGCKTPVTGAHKSLDPQAALWVLFFSMELQKDVENQLS